MALPTKHDIITNLPLVKSPKDENCFICLGPYDDRPLYSQGGDLSEEVSHCAFQTPCGHIAGEACLHRWLEDSNHCPLCRRLLFETEDHKDGEPSEQDADVANVREMLDLNVQLSLNDSENIAELATHFRNRREAQQAGDDFGTTWAERSITALSKARVGRWRDGDLEDCEDVNFRNCMAGSVVKGTLSAEQEAKVKTMDARAIVERQAWYFTRTFEDACMDYTSTRFQPYRAPDWPRHTLDIILHPEAILMVEKAIKVIGALDGKFMSAQELRGEVEGVFWETLVEGDAPWGLMAVMRDLGEVCAVGLVGEERGLRVVGMEGREVVFPGEWEDGDEKEREKEKKNVAKVGG